MNRELATLRHIISLAKRWKKFFGENPVSVSRFLREDNQRTRILTVEEENRLLASSALHLRSIVITAPNTGMRRGEILSLRWGNIDFENNIFIINVSNNKSKKVKRIPINSFVRKLLLKLKVKNQMVSDHAF